MASSQEFVDYVLEQMQEAGIMRARKMFGDYGFYCNDQFIGLICDNQCYLKVTKPGEALFKEPHYASPYEGAKPHLLIENLENSAFLKELVQVTCKALPTKKTPVRKQKVSKESKEAVQLVDKAKAQRLSSLANIGKELEKQLTKVGIYTPEELKNVGSKEAWLRILQIDPSACYNRLCALEGALQGIRWHSLADEKKAELKTFYEEHKTK